MALPDEADEGYVLEEYHGVIMLFAVLSAEDAVWEISSREMKDTYVDAFSGILLAMGRWGGDGAQ